MDSFSSSSGFQPISDALRIVWAANFGVPATKRASAPELFRFTICESTVGSAISYAAVYDALVEITAEKFLERLDVVLTQIVVLIENCVFRVG